MKEKLITGAAMKRLSTPQQKKSPGTSLGLHIPSFSSAQCVFENADATFWGWTMAEEDLYTENYR